MVNLLLIILVLQLLLRIEVSYSFLKSYIKQNRTGKKHSHPITLTYVDTNLLHNKSVSLQSKL